MSMLRRATVSLTAVVVGLAVAAGPAAAATKYSPYRATLVRTLATCQASASQPDNPMVMSRCVGDLAAPDPQSQFEIDLFRTFTNCLAWAADPDSLFPGIDPDEVNYCLDHWPGF